MPPRTGKTSRPKGAVLAGLAATLLVLVGHWAGLDRRAELSALDFRFRNIATAPPNPEIVHVDIDDRSLDELGRWPWPREQLAGIVETLQQCGARLVVLDIIMPHPQEVRFVSAAAEVYSVEFSQLLGAKRPSPVFDDALLAATLRRYPNICLPMYIDFVPESFSPQEAAASRVLTTRPWASTAEAAAELGMSPQELADPFRRSQKQVLGSKVEALVDQNPAIDLKTVVRHILPNLPPDERRQEFDFLRRAYLRTRAMHSLERLGMHQSVAEGYPARSGRITPPLVTFAESVHQSGFVTFQPEIDGVVRRIPLLVKSGREVFPQLSLAVALQEFSQSRGGDATLSANASRVQLRCPDGTGRDIPVDAEGAMLIRWMSRGPEEKAQHVPAAAVAEVWKKQRSLQRNQAVFRVACLKLAQALDQRDLIHLYEQADKLYEERTEAELNWHRAELFEPGRATPPSAGLREEEERVEAELDRKCHALLASLDFILEKPSSRPTQRSAKEDEEDAKEKEIRNLGALAIRAVGAEPELRTGLADLSAGVRKCVQGKICLIGSTSTGAADFVPTPMGPREPGVVVHANILNTILTGAFVRGAPGAVNILVILLAGAAVSLVASFRPVLQAGPLTVLLGGAYTALNTLVVFGRWSVWLVLVAPLGAMFASLLVVSAYRQLTEERAKRHIKAMFAHALSPALVDRLIEDPSLARLGGEKRVLTCFFSDLAGFTPLSLRLGEQATVALLNRYFDRMTEIVQNRCGGYVNKFIGDGIFALFGAPVFQDDHSARAIRAALECHQELAALNRALAEETDGGVELSCRIGVATGEVMVGNCGSTQRMDYTAIGDTVNLASRLEGANKFFGTRVLVADDTWRLRDGEQLLARPLGKIYVVGRSDAVTVWNVIGTYATAAPEQRQACADFAGAIDLYQQRKFAEAGDLLNAVLKVHPDDKAAIFFLDLCTGYLANPPPADWDSAIQLTEK